MKRKLPLILLSISLFSFYSCSSKPIPVPGDTTRVIRNIYIEYMNIAETYLKLKEYKSAAEYYKLAMQNHRLYWACYYKLAMCYVYSSDWANAEPMYKAMLKRDPDNSSLKASMAYIYSMNGQQKKAVKLYLNLLEEQENNEAYLENFLIITLSDKRYFKKYRPIVDEAFNKMTESYSENSQYKKIKDKYNELAEIKEEEIEDVDDLDDNPDEISEEDDILEELITSDPEPSMTESE